MPEIEKRYVVHALDASVLRGKSSLIRQAYFDTPQPQVAVRVRIIDKQRAFVTKKTGAGLVRHELEQSIPLEAARLLWSAAPYRLTKRRYRKDGWEVDFFEGQLAGLVLAEYEMQEKGQEIKLPAWINSASEVTTTLSNLQLARYATNIITEKDMPQWHKLLQLPQYVLIGGPCTGKSSLLKQVQEKHSDWQCLPEAATLLMQLGIRPNPVNSMNMRWFQGHIYRLQAMLEAVANQQAKLVGKKGLIIDRGTLDSAAFLPDGLSEFESLTETSRAAEYSRYQRVFLVDFSFSRGQYAVHKKNNPERREDYEEALEQHGKIVQLWQNHPHTSWIRGDTLVEKFINLEKAMELE